MRVPFFILILILLFEPMSVVAYSPRQELSTQKQLALSFASQSPRSAYKQNEFIVKASNASIVKLSHIYNFKISRTIGNSLFIIRSQEPVEVLINRLNSDDEIIFAEPNYKASIAQIPNDPDFTSNGFDEEKQWYLPKINAPDAWDITTGSENVVIAILDTGINYNHPDLSAKMWTHGEIPSNGQDDDGNGYIDDVNGYDFVNYDSNPMDDHGHGTKVASVAAASTNNAMGIAGVSWVSPLMAVKVMDDNGLGDFANIAQGLIYAVDNGASIVNMSLGTLILSKASISLTMDEAIDYAYKQGVTMVAAAGNNGISSISYPASNNKVISIGATDSQDMLASFSNYGSGLDLVAPGVYIRTASLSNGYTYSSGTSAAAPVVSGVAALIKSVTPILTPAEIRGRLVKYADKVGGVTYNASGWHSSYGYGRVNARRIFVNYSASHAVQRVSSTVTKSFSVRQGNSKTVSLSIDNLGLLSWKKSGDQTVFLSAVKPAERSSAFVGYQDGRWLSASRISLVEDLVNPNETGHINFKFSVPYRKKIGTYTEYFRLRNTAGIYFGPTIYWKINILRASLKTNTPTIYVNGVKTSLMKLEKGQRKIVKVKIKNLGSATWYFDGQNKNPLRLITQNTFGHDSLFANETWKNVSQISLDQTKVLPNGYATFTADFYAPENLKSGSYTENLQLRLMGYRNFGSLITLKIIVQ